MFKAKNVKPKKWSEIEVLFDDGDYSIIIGKFQDKICLGERWNGDEFSIGYPNQGSNPLWHVVYSHFSLPILHKVLDLHLNNTSKMNQEEFDASILAIEHFNNLN